MKRKWLVTLKKDAKLEHLDEALEQLNCERSDEEAIPLGDDEQVVAVSGPADLPQKLESNDDVIAVYPNSDFTLDV
jgi:hypothetical protein